MAKAVIFDTDVTSTRGCQLCPIVPTPYPPSHALHITVVLPPDRGENLCISLWTDSAGGLASGPTTFCLKFGQ